MTGTSRVGGLRAGGPRRARRCAAAFLVATAAGAAEREYADTHPATGVTLRQEAGARMLEASVPGELLDWAAVGAADGTRRVYLLAAVEDDPEGRNILYRITRRWDGLAPVAVGLSGEVDSLAAFDLDGSGDDELLVGQPGRIWRAVPAGDGSRLELELLMEAPGLDLGARLDAHGTGPGNAALSLPAVGLLRRYHPGAAGGGTVVEYPLPRSASRHLAGLRLASPQSTLLRPQGGETYAVGPQAVGDRRLRTTLLPVDSAAAEGAREAWSRLPDPERVQWSWLLVLDGRPVLVVTTNSAEKVGVLERQKLRLFSLRGDRTQAGVGPWLAAQTSSRRWQPVEPWAIDVENDGDDDLVVAQLDGLGGGKVRIEAFVNSGRKSFLARTRDTVIERPAAAWHFGDDLTGDGLPDLVLFNDGALEVYPALAGDRPGLVARQPLWSFAGGDIPRVEHSVELAPGGVVVHDPRPRNLGIPIALDVDGDGRLELAVAENPQWGFGRLRLVFLPTPE